MYKVLEETARNQGFSRVYFLPCLRLDAWIERAKATCQGEDLPGDIAAAYPFADCIALLVYPYRPFPEDEHIPSYYLNSNRAYHAVKELAAQWNAAGFLCERARLPLRALALACGIGAVGRNGLLHIAPYGSRIVLQALAVKGCFPRVYDEREPDCPQNCVLCTRACPTGAIAGKGLCASLCMRAHMDDALRSDEIKEMLSCHIGCERCMFACPFNAALQTEMPGDNLREAFDLRRLILGDTSAARGLLGKNNTSRGKLTAEAIVFAAHEGLYEAEIRMAADSPYEAVRDAARWAIEKYFR